MRRQDARRQNGKSLGGKVLLRSTFVIGALWAIPPTAQPQTCAPSNIHSTYSVGRSLVAGPGCQGANLISTFIKGPKDLPPANQAYYYFNYAEGNVGCPSGALNFHDGLAGAEGSYYFGASFLGYLPSDPSGSATCSTSACGCDGGASIELYPIDEHPQPRGPCDPPPGVPPLPANSGPSGNMGKPVNVLTGNVWFDQTDSSIPGVGSGLTLTRSYNSAVVMFDIVGGGFGRGWTHRFESKITVLPTDVLKLRAGNGEPLYFYDPDGDLTYQVMLPKVETSWIVKTPTTYTRYFRAGGSETYDSDGRLTVVADASGNVTTLTRDPNGNLISITDAGSRALTLEYDGNGHAVSLSGPGGVIASYGYDSSGFLQRVGYPDGSGYTFAYDSAARILSVTDATGMLVEAHTYDSDGRGLTSEIGNGQEKLTFSYGTLRTLVSDVLGHTTVYDWISIKGITRRVAKITGDCESCGAGAGESREYTYDDAGRVLTEKDALGKITTYTYNASGDRLTETDALNRTTTYTYDSQGRVLTVSRPGGGLTTNTWGPAGPLTITEKVTTTQNRQTSIGYFPNGKPQTITDPRGKITTLGYNGMGDLTSVTDPLTHPTGFGYDTMGRRTTVTDALSHTTTTTYDARGRVTRITNHDGTHTDFVYDLGGRRTSVTDPLGRTTYYTYDGAGRLERVVDPLNGVTAYAYDAMSHLLSLTDAKGQTTAFEYDIFDRVDRVTYPGGGFETFTYDYAGRLNTKTDRKSVVTTYTYDDLGRLLGKSYSDGTPAVSYTYDPAGLLQTAANGTDTLTWTYDLSGQLLSEQSTKNASTVAYTYDNGGNRLSVSLGGQVFVTYAYDDDSRLTTITKGTSNFTFGYDNAHRRTTMGYPNGIATGYTYDNLNRLTRLKADLGATPITDFQYTYDNAGNRTSKAQLDYTEQYGYDPLYRLTGVDRTGGSTGRWRYGYDAVGNRTSTQLDNSVSTAAYNVKNQLLSTTGGGPLRVRGTLDEPGTATVNGQPAAMLAGNAFETTIQATASTNNLTVQATDPSGNVTNTSYQVAVSGTPATYTHDLNGNLTQKVEGPDTWVYEWNAENQLKRVLKNGSEVARYKYDPLRRRVEKVAAAAVTQFTYDQAGILREEVGGSFTFYVHGPAVDEPLAVETGGVTTSLHADALGSVLAATSASGAPSGGWRYGPWGQPEVARSGHSFTGREWDTNGSLYYYRARFYDPAAGRFLSEDPSGFEDGMNMYSYVRNAPVNLIDPTGRISTSDFCKRPANAYVCFAAGVCAIQASVALWGFRDNTPGNAMKHCAWACCTVRAVGATATYDVATSHEFGVPRPCESNMDMTNNAIGIALGLANSGNCLNLCDPRFLKCQPNKPPCRRQP